jgi:hypothetical protein
VRLFRGYELAAEVDEYGFHKKKEAKARRDAMIEALTKEKKFDELMSLYRKEPSTPTEALRAAGPKYILMSDLCNERLRQLDLGKDRFGREEDVDLQEGDLVWTNGRMSDVKFIPKRGGKWHISQMPVEPNNIKLVDGMPYPGNMTHYRAGCDPYDAMEIRGKGSEGAIVVKRRWNELYEKNLDYSEVNGKLEVENVEDMVTNQTVCDYRFREKDPEDFFDDVLKTCWFFGVAVFPELDKPGLVNWLYKLNCHFMVQLEPGGILKGRRSKPRRGMKASNEVISTYIELLKMHVKKYIWAEKHRRVIEDWAVFTKETRTKRDLTVASGYAELANMETAYDKQKQEENIGEGWDVFNYV